jgi:fumarate reductase subunit C
MFRSILGFALLAVVAWFALKLVFGMLGFVVGIASTVLWLAFIGFVVYIALRLISPRTADRIRDMIKGRPADAS